MGPAIKCLMGLLASLASLAVWAQAPQASPDEELRRLSEILDTPVIVTSRSPRLLRESPGIVTVFRREDILATGARDLMEVLQLLPGFDFASDSQGVVGLGIRTAWAHDGKVLLLIDGQEMNEPFYATTQFGAHYPLDNVERIEIIRGPGSAIYGGYAELAVINVLTRRGGQINGVSGSLRAGHGDGSLLSRGADLAFGKAWADTEFSLAYSGGLSPRGQGDFPLVPITPGQARSVKVGDVGQIQTDFLNLGLSVGGLDVRYIRDRYRLTDFTEEFQAGLPQIAFPSDFIELSYKADLGNAWTLRPRFSFKEQSPWNYKDVPESIVRHPEAYRYSAGLNATWKAGPAFQLLLGAEGTREEGKTTETRPFLNGLTRITYENKAVLTQATWSPAWGNLDVGARLDHHSEFGNSFSPRVAYTLASSGWHFKVLAAGAFRAPAIENLQVNPSLRPERTRTYEIEVGKSLGPSMYLTGNVYFLRIHDPISYVNPAPGIDWYANFDYTGSTGVELDLQSRWATGSLRSTFSYSRASDHAAEFYRVQGNDAFHVGFPNLKFTSLAQFQMGRGWSVNPSLIVMGPRYGYRLGDTQATSFSTTTLLNLWITWATRNRGFEVGMGGTNLLDVANPLIQAYGTPGAGGNPPLPGTRRNLNLRLSWHF